MKETFIFGKFDSEGNLADIEEHKKKETRRLEKEKKRKEKELEEYEKIKLSKINKTFYKKDRDNNHQEESKKTAYRNGKEFKKDELVELFLSEVDYPIFQNDEEKIESFYKKYERTWNAIVAIFRVRECYLKTGKLRYNEEFYMTLNKDGLMEYDKTGKFMKKVLDELISEGKLISEV